MLLLNLKKKLAQIANHSTSGVYVNVEGKLVALSDVSIREDKVVFTVQPEAVEG